MFNDNRLLTKKSTTKTIRINFSPKINTLVDDTSLPQEVAVISYNTDCASGSLKSQGGITQFSIVDSTDDSVNRLSVNGVEFIKGWYYNKRNYTDAVDDHRIILLGDDEYLYRMSVADSRNGLTKILGKTFPPDTCALNYKLDDKDVLLLSSQSGGMVVYDGESTPYSLPDAPKAKSIALHYERLFATCGDNVLWFSDDLDPTNWNISLDQAGYIEFADERGKLLKLVSFDDYLYIFRQYGITRLSAYALQEDFTVTQLYTSGNSIYPDTVKICGNKIVFLAEDGIYTSDGLSVSKTAGEISQLVEGVDNSSAVAGYKGGKYYLACRLNYNYVDDENLDIQNLSTGNNSIIILNTANGDYTVNKDMCVSAFGEFYVGGKTELAMFFGDDNADKVGVWCQNGRYFDNNLDKNHICPLTDLGYADRKKDLLFLYIDTKEDVTVKLCVDGKWKFYEVSGKSGYQRLYLKVQGEMFRLAFSSKCKTMRVRPCILVYKVY